MQDLKRIRYVTENYRNLQGLTEVPLGLFYLMLGGLMMAKPTWFPEDGGLFPLLFFLGTGISIYLSEVIENYYEHRFGHVEPVPASTRRQWLKELLWLLMFIIATAIQDNWNPPVNVFQLMIAALMLVSIFRAEWRNRARKTRRFRTHHIGAALLFALLLAAVSLLPLLGIKSWHFWPLLLIAGGLMILGLALVDHLLLVRMLKPVPEEDHEPAN
jgi:peptidoglycan/LPS O-acetylase OafA/YrhL